MPRMPHKQTSLLLQRIKCGRGAPPGEHHGHADRLKDAGKATDGDGVERALLGEELCNDLRIELEMCNTTLTNQY